MSSRFAPLTAKHAIEQVAFAVYLPKPLEEEVLKQVRSQNLFKNRYPSCVDHLGVMTGVGSFPPGFAPLALAPQPHLVALQFCDRTPDYTMSLFMQERQISAVLKQYDSWSTTAPAICEELGVLLEMSGQRAETLTLSYHDKFISMESSSPSHGTAAGVQAWEQKEMFAGGCPYLPANIFSQSGPWHSNHGFFENTDDGRSMLVNINLQRQAFVGREEITMLTSYALHGQHLEHTGIRPTFDFLHGHLKKAARNVLSPAVGEALGLL